MMMKRISFVLVCLLMVSISAKAQHKLGEIIDFNGVKGMVFLVDADGEHGLAMSVKKCSENWLADKEAKFETSSFYEDDGEKNMKASRTTSRSRTSNGRTSRSSSSVMNWVRVGMPLPTRN